MTLIPPGTSPYRFEVRVVGNDPARTPSRPDIRLSGGFVRRLLGTFGGFQHVPVGPVTRGKSHGQGLVFKAWFRAIDNECRRTERRNCRPVVLVRNEIEPTTGSESMGIELPGLVTASPRP